MADTTYQPKTYRKDGGDEIVVADEGKITVEPGGIIDNQNVVLYEDFLGEAYNTAFWGTTETALNAAIALSADVANGALAMVLDSDDNSEIAALHFGDNECLRIDQGLIFEARLTLSVLPLTGTETVQAVWGVAGAHNATLDTIDCNAWFRVESAANTALLWETDDNVTDDNDNAAGITLVAGTYNVYKIDMTDPTAVKFYVDDVLVGTGSMAGLTAAIGDVQPYFNVSKVQTTENTGTGTMLIDYVKIYQQRS